MKSLEYSRSNECADLPIVRAVAAALVDEKGRVLIAQRPEGKGHGGIVGVSRW